MPTINKQTVLNSTVSASGSVDTFGSMLRTMSGFEVSTTNQNIYVNGKKDVSFRLFPLTATQLRIGLALGDGTEFTYVTAQWPNNMANVNHWIREYTAVSSENDKLVTLGLGPIGSDYSDAACTACLFISEDVNGNRVYGIGNGGIEKLYCPETDNQISLGSISFVVGRNKPNDFLGDKAQFVKAVNLCDENLPEMKNVYTALFRPYHPTNDNNLPPVIAAQRYYVSGALWGCIGDNGMGYKCNIFDPVVKI